ncbi:hypothetical protein HDU67_007489 [Dinochytrium kinnereticum]|nr:hypothetical protein HDU67_007489 [Dinochytrium kinnereticum]
MPVSINDSSVTVTRPTSSVEIYHHGATVTSWKVQGKEKLFLSSQAILNGSKAIRGGIPLVFPQFGTVAGSPLPQHGFARTSKWKWLGTEVDNDHETVVSFGLTPETVDPKLYALWPHPFALTYTIRLGASTLKTSLSVKNTGPDAFAFTTLLHTYFGVQDLANMKITNLTGGTFVDKVANGASFTETNEHVTIAGEVDRVYENVKASDLSIIDGSNTTKVAFSGFNDIVVWNPWIEKAKGMADFQDDGYLNMVCVEAGKVSSSVSLGPSEEWVGEQTLSA